MLKTARPSNRAGNRQPSNPPAAPPPKPNPQAGQKVGIHRVKQLLNEKREGIQRAIPQGLTLTADGLIQNCLIVLMRDTRLATCKPYSILDSVLVAAQVGLDFVGDQIFLVPHEHHVVVDGEQRTDYNYCVPWLGYKGMISVAGRFGWNMDVQLVCQQDPFKLELGTSNTVTHSIGFGPRGEMIGGYCVIRDQPNLVKHIEAMSRKELDDIADMSKDKQTKQRSWAWAHFFEAMCKKTICRRAYKWIPKDHAYPLRMVDALETRLDNNQEISDLARPGEPADPDAASDVL